MGRGLAGLQKCLENPVSQTRQPLQCRAEPCGLEIRQLVVVSPDWRTLSRASRQSKRGDFSLGSYKPDGAFVIGRRIASGLSCVAYPAFGVLLLLASFLPRHWTHLSVVNGHVPQGTLLF